MNPANDISKAAFLMKASKHAVVFTGAGISVESGIPPFRGAGGLWETHDPSFIELNYFLAHPKESWEKMKTIFFDFMVVAKPNAAHVAVANLEKAGYVKSTITQNIDGLHQKAGSRVVYEFHGTIEHVLCLNCGKKFPSNRLDLNVLPPHCTDCGGLLKPDFVFFSEGIPEDVSRNSFREAARADVLLVVGTTGEVMPAAMIPETAKSAGAKIIEINTSESAFTRKTTDLFLGGKATDVLTKLFDQLTLS